MKFLNNKNGYTLLFSIIVASIVLSIAAFILSTSRKQFILSSVARDSTIAVYAADGGTQCVVEAFYKGKLATSSSATVVCNGETVSKPFSKLAVGTEDVSMGLYNDGPSGYRKIEQTPQDSPIQFIFPNNTCVRIVVTVGFDNVTKEHKVIFDSRGYNIANSGPCVGTPPSPRAIERAIRTLYHD